VNRDAGVGPDPRPGTVGVGANTSKAGGINEDLCRDPDGVGGCNIAGEAIIELGLGKDLAQIGGQDGEAPKVLSSEEAETGAGDGRGLDREA
jgi:hypothetical protein